MMLAGNRRTPTTRVLVVMLGLSVLAAGCSTVDPVVAARADAALGSLALVRNEAELGIRARTDPVCAERLGVPVIGPEQAAFIRETLDYLEAHLRALKARGLGHKPAGGLPAGPTAEALSGKGVTP